VTKTFNEWDFDLDTLEKDHENIYFIGIGGISMSCLAQILYSRGFRVAGSDYKSSETTEHLRNSGIRVAIGHDADNIAADTDLVVYSAAIKPDNPELAAARQKGIRTVGRAVLLGAIMAGFERPVCVSGTHGKTTTTSIISEILIKAGLDPTVSLGGILPSIKDIGAADKNVVKSRSDGSNFRLGRGPYFVVEACEYADSFLHFRPFIGVILNVEADHLDYFADIGQITQSFAAFARSIGKNGKGGFLIINAGIPMIRDILKNLSCKVITFGEGGQWQADNLVFDEGGRAAFDVIHNGEILGNVHLKVPGAHNAQNALAAAAAADALGIGFGTIAKGLGEYTGVRRRFEVRGNYNGAAVVDDYAHHPSEIAATLAAASNIRHENLICVFQPHTYSRTKALFEELAASFSLADTLILTDIYAAREKDKSEISSLILAERVRELWGDKAGNVLYIKSFEDIVAYLEKNCIKNDMLITMGAGDVYLVGEMLLNGQLSTLSTEKS